MASEAPPSRLYRFGVETETAEDLESQCEAAAARGFPHGVSAVSDTTRPDVSMAAGTDIALYFEIRKTGRSPFHYTVVLPHPVTAADATNLNRLFGRA